MSLARTLARTLVAASLASTLTSAAGAEPTPRAATPAAAPSKDPRRITFNGAPATARDLEILARFERVWGVEVPSGDYWYDDVSGAAGLWGGPMRGALGAGLGLGGKRVPANASGGGTGQVTGVFINGRELHPLDVQGLTALFGQAPWPGQWWVDGQGWFGMPGQPALGNLFHLVAMRNQARGGGGDSYYKSDITKGKSTFVGSGCAAVHARKSPDRSDSDTYSYYVGCE